MGPARSLRARLTLWYTAALGVLLVVLGATALGLLERGLRDNVDTALRTRRAWVDAARLVNPLAFAVAVDAAG